MNTPICVNDYGSEVYRCHWSGVLVAAEDAIVTGPVMPKVKAQYIAAPGYGPFRKQSVDAFNEWDQNCNTCKHLERVKHDKDKFGFLYGRCLSTPIKHPYKLRDNGNLMFHPDDYMGMECYEPRK